MTNADLADICRALGACLAAGIVVLFVVLDPLKRDRPRLPPRKDEPLDLTGWRPRS